MDNVYFRVDGSSTIGLGHIYRGLAFHKMIENYYDNIFVISPSSKVAIPILEDHQVQNIMIDEEDSYIDQLSEKDIVIIDGYQFDSAYQLRVKKKGCKLVVIDDLHDKHFYADALINTALGLTHRLYDAEKHTKFYFGPEYVLLRTPFLDRAKIPFASIASGIVVCIGGSDPLNITGTIVSVLAKHFNDHITVVIGAGYAHRASLESRARQSSNVRISQNLSADELVCVFSENEIIITSASVTAYEALCCNNKLVVGHYTNNQLDMYNGLISANAARGVGSFANLDNDGLRQAIIQLKSSAIVSKRLIDGKSPGRILELMRRLGTDSERMNIRSATSDDAQLLFEWTNDSDVRNNSINTGNILWENHVSWLNKKLQSGDILLILEKNGIPVGQVRFDYDETELHWIINFSIAKEYRGRGMGKAIVEYGIKHVNKFPMVAYVKPSNIASTKVFESLNFNNMGLTQLKNVELFRFIRLK